MDKIMQDFIDAAHEEDLQTVSKLIIPHGFEKLTNTLKEYIVLQYAISINNTEITKLLLTSGTDIKNHLIETLANTPILLAVLKDYIEIINMLLERAANVNIPNNHPYGIPFLKYAIRNDFSHRFAMGALFYKIKYGNCQTVEYLLRHAIKGNLLDSSTLWLAVVTGDIKMLKLLLESEANEDTKDSNSEVLNAAVCCQGEQYGEIIEILLQNGFTVNDEHVNDHEFLHAAVAKGYLKIIEALLKYGVDVNMQSGWYRLSLLHIAVRNKQEQMVTLLISYAADLNAKNKFGKTPIFDAIKNGDLNMTKLLLNNRAIAKASPELLNIAQSDVDVNATDIDGKTPLHYVTNKDYQSQVGYFALIGPHEYNADEEIAKLLLNRGANINAAPKYGFAPFQLAIEKDNKKIVEAFLENVDVNSTFKDDFTPLHYSAKLGRVAISKMLLSKGANVNAKLKKNNWTPLHFAVCMKNKALIEVLLRCGARVDSEIISDINSQSHLSSKFDTTLATTGSDIFEVLQDNGADINSRNELRGVTVLYDVVLHTEAKHVIDLLNLGADINIASKGIPLNMANSQTNTVLFRHIAKLKAANLYLSEQILIDFISFSRNTMRDFQNECNEEISRMKSEYIANTNASFYNILSRDVSQSALYARNKNIVQALESGDYKRKFPIYASMIECNFKRGKRRKILLEGSNAVFGNISNNFPNLPYNCNEEILSYLSEPDLRNLMVNFRNVDGREELLEQGYRYFHFLFINIPDFSYDFTEKIFSHLSDDDLRNLVEACKSAKLCNSTFPPLPLKSPK